MANIYQEQLKWAKDRGLLLDPRIERKTVNGVSGLYASADIPANTRLIAYPVDKAIKNVEDPRYTANTSPTIKQIHAALLEYCKGDASEYYGHFMQFESLDQLKPCSTYFYSEEDLKLLESMNIFLAKSVREINDTLYSRVAEIKALEPKIDEDKIITVLLNYHSRAWTDANFLPVMDYANHSDRLGKKRTTKDGYFVLEAKQDYKQGDEIYLSYGRKDIYFHAIYYNYFDPNGVHYIQYGPRFVQVAGSPIEKEIAKYTATKFNMDMRQLGDNIHYSCLDQDVCFLETGPSLKMIEFIQANYFSSMQEWQAKKCSPASLAQRLLDILNLMISANNVDSFEAEKLPARLARFHPLLQKEKQMLLKNKEWVIDNFYL
jgi:hypothetical protein